MTFSLHLPGEEQQKAGPVQAREVENLLIIGGGMAGFTAAIYAGRALLDPLVLVGPTPGGQTATTDLMENFPGFPEGIPGGVLAQKVQEQAERFGARIVMDEVREVDFSQRPFLVKTWDREYRARAVIVATGAAPRRLGVPGEDRFIGRGVSFCATCDGFFYRDKEVVVVGGGDAALDEGLFLTRFARRVTIVHRRDQLRAQKLLQQRAFANERIRFIWDTVVTEILGETRVEGVRLRNLKTGEEQVLPTDGVFVYIGMNPNTALFRGQLALDENGYIITDKRQRTNIPGVYAAGDVQDPWFRQSVIAAASGAAAAMDAERFLAEQEGAAG
ncbi:MAG: thioredoxin-disulfide reductase [Anaerolineae bacterium]